MPDANDGLPEIRREMEEDFASLYANNVSYEPSVWDLKLLFGELDQKVIKGPGHVTIDYHTAITVPWTTVKSMVYYLRANLAAHEAEAGPVKLPERVTPPRPTEPEDNPAGQAVVKVTSKIWDEEFG